MSKVKNLFRGWRKSTTDLSEWNKNDEKLMKAVENANVAKVQLLLTKKTLVLNKLGPKGLTVFQTACSLGQLRIVDQLLEHGAEFNSLSIKGTSAVQLAARNGWPQVVKRLIEVGAVLDHRDSSGLTALHQGCVECQVECVQALLQGGVNVNASENTGKTSLFFASHKGDVPVCKELLFKGADVNLSDENQISPLMAAANRGHRDVCELLLRKGADPKQADSKGHVALWYAMQANHTQLKEVFEKAPTRASWDLHAASDTEPQESASEGSKASGSPRSEMPEADQVDMVAQFVADDTPKMEKKELSVATETKSEVQKPQGQIQKESVSVEAAGPPRPVMDDRTIEAYKELEEEHEEMRDELSRLTLQNRRLQEKLDETQSQTQDRKSEEMEKEVHNLKNLLSQEKERSQELGKQMEMLMSGHSENHIERDEHVRSADDSWNDSEGEELFDSPEKKAVSKIPDDKQMVVLLRSQILTLRQENEQLKEKVQTLPNGLREPSPYLFPASTDQTVPGKPDQMSTALAEEMAELKKKISSMELEKLALVDQIRENNGVDDGVPLIDELENENRKMYEEIEKLKTEIKSLKNSLSQVKISETGSHTGDSVVLAGDSDSANLNKVPSGDNSSASPDLSKLSLLEEENAKLKMDCSALQQNLEGLRDTYEKLIQAGDNLQNMYDQLLQEKDNLQEDFERTVQEKEEIMKENEDLLSDGNAMHDDLEKLVHELENLQEKYKRLEQEKEDLDSKMQAVSVSGKASEVARTIKERDHLQQRCAEMEKMTEGLKHDHEIVLEEVQSLQESYTAIQKERDEFQQTLEAAQDELEACSQLQNERDELNQAVEALQDEIEQLQQNHEGLQQDYTQLEQDYTELLSDKEKLEQEFMEVQTGSIQVEQRNPILQEERDNLVQENSVLAVEKEQLEMTIKELSKANALLEEEISKLKTDIQNLQTKLKNQTSVQAVQKAGAASDTDRRIQSLQVQVSRLQQQLAETDRHHRDVVNTYRTHLISAVQGHMDTDVQQALYNIIELRSMEQFC